MAEQNAKNHLRFYPPHHFVLLPACLAATAFFAYQAFAAEGGAGALWGALAFLAALQFAGLLMLRQHYALGNQDRIIRLEMRLRYFQVARQSFEDKEARLSLGQIIALRFADDNQLMDLVDETIAESLSPKEIKARVKRWQPDHMRV